MMSAKIEDGLVISYLTLRRAIGFLGLLWPFVLALGGMIIFGTTLQDTISAYYYTPMFGVFVGTLWAVGFFLFTYNGYDNNRWAKDWVLSRAAWVCALGSALFPTHKDTGDHGLAGYLHLLFVGTLFLIFIYFSLALFTMTSGRVTPEKIRRNKVYRLCGWVMAAAIALIVVYYRLPEATAAQIAPYRPIFWLESVTIVSFGISWLVKGEFLLKDSTVQPPETPKAKPASASV